MGETLEAQRTLKFSEEELEHSNNQRVQEVISKMKDKDFWDRVCSYSEKYWDYHHSQTW